MQNYNYSCLLFKTPHMLFKVAVITLKEYLQKLTLQVIASCFTAVSDAPFFFPTVSFVFTDFAK